MTKQKPTKDEIYWRIFDTVLRLDVQKGHLKWKITDLSRASKINRTLIYYYFGDSKEEIIKNATLSVAEVFFGNKESNLQQLLDGDISGVVMNSRRMVEKSPYVVDYYLTWRRQENDISKILTQVEDRYFEKLKKIFPALDLDSLKAIYAIFFGLVANPAISHKAIEIACDHIREQFQQKS